MTVYYVERWRWDEKPMAEFAKYEFGWVKCNVSPIEIFSSMEKAVEHISNNYLENPKFEWEETGEKTEPILYTRNFDKYKILITKKEID